MLTNTNGKARPQPLVQLLVEFKKISAGTAWMVFRESMEMGRPSKSSLLMPSLNAWLIIFRYRLIEMYFMVPNKRWD